MMAVLFAHDHDAVLHTYHELCDLLHKQVKSSGLILAIVNCCEYYVRGMIEKKRYICTCC